MTVPSDRWHIISKSNFAWEQEALDYLRKQIPDSEEWHVWPGFDFIASGGAIYEVDALVLSPVGLWLVEIKSHPGKFTSEEGLWVFEHESRRRTIDNPVVLTNNKAKCIKGLIQSHLSNRRLKMPWVTPVVFCAGHPLKYKLKSHEEAYVALREDNIAVSHGSATGIVQAMTNGDIPGVSRNLSNLVSAQDRGGVLRALEDMVRKNVLRSASSIQKVGDYKLKELLDEGAGYQDWLAEHQSLKTQKRRIRLYLVHDQATKDERAQIQRAAEREARILENIQDPGILTYRDFISTDRGPGLIFDHHPDAIRLDQYLTNLGKQLDMYKAYEMLEKIVDATRQAHSHHLIHRALSPRSILCIPKKNDPEGLPQLALMNWQTASSQATTKVTMGTMHVEDLVETQDAIYLAPEALMNPDTAKASADVFSLACIAYRLFSGKAPARNQMDLNRILQDQGCLSLSSVIDGVPPELQTLIECATHPNPEYRTTTVRGFQEDLDDVFSALVGDQAEHLAEDPVKAQKGEQIQDDESKELYIVEQRIGVGSSAIALRIKDSKDNTLVAKIARDQTKKETIESEFAHLQKLNDRCVVKTHKLTTFSGNTAILMDDAGQSLAAYIRELGRLQYDMLQRLGEDLIRTLDYLEEQGVFHRDLKPENIGVTYAKSGSKKVIPIIFDFSLAGVGADKLGVGTRQYIDPFLSNRRIKRYDTHAERYALAVTLYEMATAKLPVWEGGADPSVEINAELDLASDTFPANIRDELGEFFYRALHRDIEKRFDNSREMLREWSRIFEEAEDLGRKNSIQVDEKDVTPETEISCLGLSPRAIGVLDRMNVLSLGDVLSLRMNDLKGRRGISLKTKKEIISTKSKWKEKYPEVEEQDLQPAEGVVPTQLTEESAGRIDEIGLDFCIDKIREATPQGKKVYEYMQAMLGFHPQIAHKDHSWVTQQEVASYYNIAQPNITTSFGKCKSKWKQSRTIASLRDSLASILESQQGVMTSHELANALLTQRGCSAEPNERKRISMSVVRVCTEVEQMMKEDDIRFSSYRYGERCIIATEQSLAQYAKDLGDKADELLINGEILPPARAIEGLKRVTSPLSLEDRRLLGLAAHASNSTALSSGRMELYSKAMSAKQALGLASGAFAGIKELDIKMLKDRVRERYPEASPLPNRPQLDTLISDLNLGYEWKEDQQAYLLAENSYRPSQGTGMSLFFNSTTTGTAKEADQIIAEDCQRQLVGSAKRGGFMALQVKYELHSEAQKALQLSFPQFQVLDLEALMLDKIKELALQKKVDWNVVIKADAQDRDSRDFKNLLALVRMALPQIKEYVTQQSQPLILIHPGMLARYEAMNLFDYWRDLAGTPNGPPGMWVLLATQSIKSLPTIDNQALPVLGANQTLSLNQHWIYATNQIEVKL